MVVIVLRQAVFYHLLHYHYKRIHQVFEVSWTDLHLVTKEIQRCLHDRGVFVAECFLHFHVYLVNDSGLELIEL